MARNIKSAVLSKEDTKAAIAAARNDIKAAKDNIKQLTGVRKEADKAFAAANKAPVAALKDNDKAMTAANKALEALNAKLATLAPAKAKAEA